MGSELKHIFNSTDRLFTTSYMNEILKDDANLDLNMNFSNVSSKILSISSKSSQINTSDLNNYINESCKNSIKKRSDNMDLKELLTLLVDKENESMTSLGSKINLKDQASDAWNVKQDNKILTEKARLSIDNLISHATKKWDFQQSEVKFDRPQPLNENISIHNMLINDNELSSSSFCK